MPTPTMPILASKWLSANPRVTSRWVYTQMKHINIIENITTFQILKQMNKIESSNTLQKHITESKNNSETCWQIRKHNNKWTKLKLFFRSSVFQMCCAPSGHRTLVWLSFSSNNKDFETQANISQRETKWFQLYIVCINTASCCTKPASRMFFSLLSHTSVLSPVWCPVSLLFPTETERRPSTCDMKGGIWASCAWTNVIWGRRPPVKDSHVQLHITHSLKSSTEGTTCFGAQIMD